MKIGKNAITFLIFMMVAMISIASATNAFCLFTLSARRMNFSEILKYFQIYPNVIEWPQLYVFHDLVSGQSKLFQKVLRNLIMCNINS